MKFFFTDFSPLIKTVVPGARMITVGAQGRSNGCGVKKNLDYNYFISLIFDTNVL